MKKKLLGFGVIIIIILILSISFFLVDKSRINRGELPIFVKKVDYIIDAIDTVTAKLALVEYAKANEIPIISCMGTGNKLCPELFEIADIYKTSVCPLAKVMRKELKNLGVNKLIVLYSKEEPIKSTGDRLPASISFTPSIAGLRIAEYVIKEFMK